MANHRELNNCRFFGGLKVLRRGNCLSQSVWTWDKKWEGLYFNEERVQCALWRAPCEDCLLIFDLLDRQWQLMLSPVDHLWAQDIVNLTQTNNKQGMVKIYEVSSLETPRCSLNKISYTSAKNKVAHQTLKCKMPTSKTDKERHKQISWVRCPESQLNLLAVARWAISFRGTCFYSPATIGATETLPYLGVAPLTLEAPASMYWLPSAMFYVILW